MSDPKSEFWEWVKEKRSEDLKKLVELAKKECYPWVHDELDLYYCLSELYKRHDIHIPLNYWLVELVHEIIIGRMSL